MSINQIIKIYQSDLEGFKKADYYTFDFNFNLSKVVIPFSKMFQSHKPTDIYCGKEKIPFRERETDYKMILRHEFSDLLK